MPPMTGSRYFAEAMQAYEITHVFLVPTILTPALAEMESLNIVRVTAHSEKAAVYMADGYARISGRPGVAMAQTIGAANLAGRAAGPLSGLCARHCRHRRPASRKQAPRRLPGSG